MKGGRSLIDMGVTYYSITIFCDFSNYLAAVAIHNWASSLAQLKGICHFSRFLGCFYNPNDPGSHRHA